MVLCMERKALLTIASNTPEDRRIRVLLEATKTTQTELARVIGVSRPHLSNIVAGRVAPSFRMARRIAEYFRLPIEVIFPPAKREVA